MLPGVLMRGSIASLSCRLGMPLLLASSEEQRGLRCLHCAASLGGGNGGALTLLLHHLVQGEFQTKYKDEGWSAVYTKSGGRHCLHPKVSLSFCLEKWLC